MIRKLSGFVLSAILAVLGLIHTYWALGGRRGLDHVLPTQHGVRLLDPAPPMIWLVAGSLFGAAAVPLGRAKIWGVWLPPRLFRWALRGMSGLFLLRAVGDFRVVGWSKTASETVFARWDTWLYSPLCALMALLAALADAAPEDA